MATLPRIPARGWAAPSADDPLAPVEFERRAPRDDPRARAPVPRAGTVRPVPG